MTTTAQSIDPDVFGSVEMLKTAFHRKRDETELMAIGVSLLGGSALLLACAGIVGLVAYCGRAAHQGDRDPYRARGDRARRCCRSVLRQLSRPVAVRPGDRHGAAAALSQILRRELYGVSHLDPSPTCRRRGLRRHRGPRRLVAGAPRARSRSAARAEDRLVGRGLLHAFRDELLGGEVSDLPCDFISSLDVTFPV